MSLRNSHPVFDIESEIVKARNQPSPVDLKLWQDRIEKIAGFSSTGKPRLRIVWGQAADMFSCGRMAKKYCFWKLQQGAEIHDIGIPRFYVEELHTNTELKGNDGWNRARYYRDEVTGETIDVLGPLPEEGFYTCVFMIAHHDDLCCSGKEVVRHEPCLGAYRPPTDADLQRIRRMKWRRDTASNDERAPSESLLEKRTESATEARDERWRRNTREVVDDYIKTRSHSWGTLDPAPFSWGKYHFMGSHNKSGLKPKETNANSSATAQDGA